MHKFEINWTMIMGGCLSERKVVTHDSKSDLPLETAKQLLSIFWYLPTYSLEMHNFPHELRERVILPKFPIN